VAAIEIPDADVELAFIRSSGPGGQNVNKVASAVQLRFNLAGTRVLSEPVKTRLRRLAGRRITEDGSLLIVARESRSQDQNRRAAFDRLHDLIDRALIEPKRRFATRPTRGSKERRLAVKRTVKQHKARRGRISWDD
jgi:ribosome-associated protein